MHTEPFTVVFVACRVQGPDAVCQQKIKEGMAAEHALDMRKAVQCFLVCVACIPCCTKTQQEYTSVTIQTHCTMRAEHVEHTCTYVAHLDYVIS